MANFSPLKSYILFLMDACVKKYAVQHPFLDAGCGKGDVALHFAKKGWHGKAVDSSELAISLARKTLHSHKNVRVSNENLLHETDKYNCVFLLDVLEHEKDDDAMLKKISGLTHYGGFLFLTVPVNPEEWGWDDEFYGHYRRYTLDGMNVLLASQGFEVRDIMNITYPFFWLLRKLYLNVFPKKTAEGTPEERTKISTLHNAYGKNAFLQALSLHAFWLPVFVIQYMLKHSTRGFELLFVAQKK